MAIDSAAKRRAARGTKGVIKAPLPAGPWTTASWFERGVAAYLYIPDEPAPFDAGGTYRKSMGVGR